MTAAVAHDIGSGVYFGLVELDLLAAHAGARFPFPLRVPEFGRIEGERQVLLAAAGSTLRGRGLASERGPVGPAAEVVTALREFRGTVDLVLAAPEAVVGVVAMVYRNWALICGQPQTGDPAALVLVRRVAQNALADALIEMVPEVAPAQAMPITLPSDSVDHADPAVLDELGELLPELTGRGQLGATRRVAGVATRSGTELSWLDSPRGRVRLDHTADGWLSMNPLRHNDIRFTLDDLAMIARREHDGS
ncbi:ESX secretion-associated protein EspG [Actinocrispum wychmicini]|uniref:ESAT-6 protein secretion system EspG family protein n=1 Tax=Actinocrispum wychmicini TaxID=1213861 RepID=A0A4R2JHW3_9PSEU|nr:ESX secretion-associated protein EspG [Actinocrispum wychmicini]TCO59471.1 ESAT-6 protein secretion system EspG family protein [Actinocrispum wychmicini]